MTIRACGRFVVSAVLGLGLGSAATAGPITYNLTDLGVRTGAGLNDAGQVALTDTTTVGVPDPIGDSGPGLRHVQMVPVTRAGLYNSYGPDAGQVTYVGPAIPGYTPGVPTRTSGAVGDTAAGITSQGQVLDGNYLTNGKTATPVVTDPPQFFAVKGVNDAGQVIATQYDGQRYHGVLVNGPTTTDLGTLPGTPSYGSTTPVAINNHGQIIGNNDVTSPNVGAVSHAFLYGNGQLTDLGTLPNGQDSKAFGLNNLGQVVGSSAVGTGSYYQATPHAFLYSQGAMHDLGTLPGGTSSQALAINDQGVAVGTSTVGSNNGGGSYGWNGSWYGASPNHAVLFENGQVTDLNQMLNTNSLHIELTQAIAINNNGQILAVGDAYDSYQSLYLLTPSGLPEPTPPTNMPEPGAWAVLALAAGAFGVKRLRDGRRR